MAYDLLDPNNGRPPDSNHIKNDIYKYEASKGQEKEVSTLNGYICRPCRVR